MKYVDFLINKVKCESSTGFETTFDINKKLYDFQSDVVRWAIKRGRAALFEDCGLGKGPQQLEWSSHIHKKTHGNILILAPLAVSKQTKREGDKFGIDVTICRSQKDVKKGINISNYEMLHKFDPHSFVGIVLDESSILKSFSGKIRNNIIESFEDTPFKLACTATPAPNDYMELGNHAEFLGVMTRSEMLAMFFVHDGGDTSKWRLKGHAEDAFWKWLCSWAVYIKKPSDLGYENKDFTLPELRIHEHIIKTEVSDSEYSLFPIRAKTLNEHRKVRKETIGLKIEKCKEIIDKDSVWLTWCNLNDEGKAFVKQINSSIEIKGSDSSDYKEKAMMDFSEGKIDNLITKSLIAGFGMNWQHCNNMIFFGLSYSWEQYYQAVRRCWRFGQKNKVNVHIIITDREYEILKTIKRKEKDADNMAKNMVKHMSNINSKNIRGLKKDVATYDECVESSDNWTMYKGDCVEILGKYIKNDSVGYSIFSPPFASLYTYSNSHRDMGNCINYDDFYEHFLYLITELYRVTQEGRLCSFHCMNIPISKQREGFIGIRDFRGELIRLFVEKGWIFHSEVVIWKDPVVAMQRTKALGLLHKQIKKDSSMSRQGIPDYIVTMRKPGENKNRLVNTDESFPVQEWQKYASPIWTDIKPSDTLQHRSVRENKDERHICPLQLEVIRRCLRLWSKENDIVLSPFAGIGSEGYESLKCGRKFIGIELKDSYFKQAVDNLKTVVELSDQLFDI